MTSNEALILAQQKGYWTDKLGNIFSAKGHKLKLNYNGRGYLKFNVVLPGRLCKSIYAHRFIAFLKFGDQLFIEGIEVRHLDNNSSNNSWNNLLLGTSSQNKLDIPKMDRIKKASLASRKITDHLSSKIKSYREDGLSYEKISKLVNLSPSTIYYYYYLNNKTYNIKGVDL